jgi:hypothetical protein
MAACSDMPRKDVPPPGSAGPAPAPRVVDEPRATPAESSPVPSSARAILEENTNGVLDTLETAQALERILAGEKDEPMTVAPGWIVSSRRALVHALRVVPTQLRSALKRYQDDRTRHEAAAIVSDVLANRLGPAIAFADHYPNSAAAQKLWDLCEKERALSPRDMVDTGLLPAPVPEGGIRLGGLTVRSDGDDAIVARDVDGNTVWEHRPHAGPAETPTMRVLGTFCDRLVTVELRKTTGIVVEEIDSTTGSDICRVRLREVKEPPQITIVGPDAIVATPQRIYVVDLLRGEVGWERAVTEKPLSIASDRVVLGPEGLGFDLETGRMVEGSAGRPHAKQGGIDVR